MLLTTLVAQTADAQSRRARKKIEAAEKKKQKQKEAELKAVKKFQKRNMEIQDKETRKRMKKHRRSKGTPYVTKRPGLFKRLFSKR